VRAVVLNGPHDVAVERIDDPTLTGDDGIIVAVDRTAICGSDLHYYEGHMGHTAGIRLGHEFLGEVVEAGPEVRSLRRGDRVFVSGVVGCGRCGPCAHGDPVRCDVGWQAFGTTPALPGGQAELVAVPAADAYARTVPEGLTTEQAVLLTDVLPTAHIGVTRADVRPGSTVAVVGLGPVGTLAVELALLFGAARVLAIDVVPERLSNAARLGAEPIDATAGDVVAQVRDRTAGKGAPCVVEAVGSDATLRDALLMCAVEGTVSVIGVNLNMQFPLPLAVLFSRNITVRTATASVPTTWPALIPLLQAGRLRPDDVFTHRLPLSAAAEAYATFAGRVDGCMKVLLDASA
jgi:2-desacetyl-2-hydroxyethyl bacteriochlorophyllide A dehydrogenase